MAADGFRLGAADFIICSLTVGVSVTIGLYHAFCGKNHPSLLQYFIGNRRLGVIPVALSVAVSYMSSGIVLGLPAEMYHYGLPSLVHACMVGIAVVLSSWIAAPLWYGLNITSAYQYLEMRFKSRLVRMAGSALGILQNVVYTGVVLIGPGAAVKAVTGFPPWATVCILGFASILYTTIGGYTAVIWTDVFQFLVMAVGVVSIVVKIFIGIGDMGEVWESLIAGKRIRMLQFNPDPTIRTSFWTTIIGGFAMWFNLAFSQQGVQRVVSMKNLSQAKKVLPYSLPAFYIFIIVGLIEGFGAYDYYANKGCDPYTLGIISDVNEILPYFVIELCQDLPGLPGLFMASLLSASLSTMSSCLNSTAAVTLTDFVQVIKPGMTDRCATWTAKSLVVIFGCMSLGVSFLLAGAGGPVSQMTIAFSGSVGGPLCGLFLLGAFIPWANVKGALAGVVSGLGIAFWIAFSGMAIKVPILPPAPSERCWLNSSTASNSTDMMHLSNTSLADTTNSDFPIYTDLPYPGSGINKMYSISFMLYPTLGLVISLSVGVIVSLITGRMDQSKVDPLCISHLIRHRYYKQVDQKADEGLVEMMASNKDKEDDGGLI